MSDLGEIEQQSEDELIKVMESGPTQEAKLAAKKAFDAIQIKHIEDDIAILEKGTATFLSLIDDLSAVIEKLGGVGDSDAKLKSLRDSLSDAYGSFRADKGLPNTNSDAEAAKPTTDETSEKPSGDPKPISKAGGVVTLSNPKPINSRDYPALSDEYIRFFLGAAIRNDKMHDVEKAAQTALQNKNRYTTVGDNLGNIPWWFIAGIHMLESSFDFNGHLHNGNSLARRTVDVPSGRPSADPAAGAGSRYTWEESAADAFTMKGFNNQSDWSLSRALYRWETYNGFGYRPKDIATPYLWSFSSIYSAGKFIADHQFSLILPSKQCGAATLLKLLSQNHEADLGLDFVDEKVESNLGGSFDHDAQQVETNQQPTVDGPLPVNGDFDQFIAAAVAAGKLPALRHFKPGDFFVKGGANAANGLNTDPPKELWPNILNVMKVVDEFRERIGHPVMLNSVYRSEAYNASVGGVSGSQHKKFQAADIRVVGSGTPPDWAQVLKGMRAANFFHGGIGVYNTFVHVDTRGWDANW